MITQAEYIWIDGANPTQELRSKSRVIEVNDSVSLSDFPKWGFDGSSTNQAEGRQSDCLLSPCSIYNHPFTEGYLVLCEVLNADGTAHKSNSRAVVRKCSDC